MAFFSEEVAKMRKNFLLVANSYPLSNGNTI
jgi:hypothetical protein